MSDKHLKTLNEFQEAYFSHKTITVWNYNLGDILKEIKFTNSISFFEAFKDIDLEKHWFSVKEDVPEYRPFESVEEIEPYFGKVVYHESKLLSGVIVGASKSDIGKTLIYIGIDIYYCTDVFEKFKFKDGTPVGIKIEKGE